MSSLHPTDVRVSITELAKHGAMEMPNHDGWGIAYYEGPDVRLIKEAGPAGNSAWVRFIESMNLRSRIVVGHIRHMTRGKREYRDTQPFVRELGGRMHTFAHNGDLGDAFAAALSIGSFRPIGNTDSEHAFCALLALLDPLWRQPGNAPGLGERLALVNEFATTIRRLGPANFIYSDGEVVFAHGHMRQQQEGGALQPGLHYLTRLCVDPDAFVTPAVSVAGRSQAVTLLASVPLSNEPWATVEPGQVVVVKNGELLGSMPGCMPNDDLAAAGSE